LAVGGVRFAKDSADLDARAQRELDAFSEVRRLNLPIFPELQIKVKSHRLPDENANLDDLRVASVIDFLRRRGFSRNAFYQKEGRTVSLVQRLSASVGANAAAPYVTLQYRKSSAQQFLQADYCCPVAAHEFGHMLGLPDEYPLSKKMRNEKQAARDSFYELCAKFHVPQPPFDTYSISLMSTGVQVLPAHYVTLAEAVDQHLRTFYSPAEVVNRRSLAAPGGGDRRRLFSAAVGDLTSHRPIQDYEIGIGAILRETHSAKMIPIQRYIPLEHEVPELDLGPAIRAEDFLSP
jgi:hypothetical protein